MRLHQIKSIHGDVLYEGFAPSFKELLVEAVEEGASLQYANLRKQNLQIANLDGADFRGACFHGANLRGANLSECLLEEADFRLADLAETCLAESSMIMCKFDGAYFSSGTIITGADFSGSTFSCPTFFNLKLSDAASTYQAIYSHMGEIDCPIAQTPIVIHGLPFVVVFMDKHLKIGTEVKTYAEWSLMTGEDVQKKYGMAARRFFEDFYLAGLFSANALDRFSPAGMRVEVEEAA
jgi:hypothetical protein